MLRKTKLSRKMSVIGLLAIMALSVLYGVVSVSNRMVRRNVTMEKLRNQQLHTINNIRKRKQTLVLAAMEATLHKARGQVTPERMHIINTCAAHLEDNLPVLHAAADTEEEKRLARAVERGIVSIIKGVKEDLITLISHSGAEVRRIELDFERLADALDEAGESVSCSLSLLENALHERMSGLANSGDCAKFTKLANAANVHTIQVWQWLTDISATRAAEGYDDGFEEAEKHAVAFRQDMADLLLVNLKMEQEIDQLTESFEAFYEQGKRMAHQYIKGGPEAGNPAMDEFDSYAADICTKIEVLLNRAEQDLAAWEEINGGVVLVNYMAKELGMLMLGAKDSIIDKADGKLDEQRLIGIDQALTFLNANLTKLEGIAKTSTEKDALETLRSGLAQLEQSIKTDLVQLIEQGAVKIARIEQEFVDVDDILDQRTRIADENLTLFEISVEGELNQASAAMVSALSTARNLALAGYVICSALLSIALALVTGSIVKPIKCIVENLTEGAEQVSAASGQLSGASQSLAEGATEQAAGLEETSSSLEQMASMTRQNADHAQQANSLAAQARQAADNGTASMTRMSTAIREIQQSSDKTAKIIKVIDEIAFQTNLLALNAAVEAARAGEAGKGFAVVAEEVRNLAMRSAEAAQNTAGMIEESVKNANNGVGIACEVGNVLDEIVGCIGQTTDLVGEIATASREQAQGIDQVNTAVSQMDKITQQNAANAEQSASASEELRGQSGQMIRIVAELNAVVGGARQARHLSQQHDPKEMPALDADSVLHQIAAKATQTAPKPQRTMQAQSAREAIPLDPELEDFNR